MRKPPKNYAEFDALMQEIDRSLQVDQTPIFARQFKAVGKVSRLLNMELTLAPLSTDPIPNNFTGDSLTAHIVAWMNHRYGDRLKMETQIGTSVIPIRNDPWLVTFPVIYGTVTLVCDRNLSATYPNMVVNRAGMPKQTAYLNVLKLIDRFPQGLAAQLTDTELQGFLDRFVACYTFFRSIHDEAEDSDLPFAAITDLRSSARYIVESREEGQARWSSLQAAEKVLKYYLRRKQGTFPKTHNLASLSQLAEKQGLPEITDESLATIQCDAGVRYQSGGKDFTGALRAHLAAVDIGISVMQTLFLHP